MGVWSQLRISVSPRTPLYCQFREILKTFFHLLRLRDTTLVMGNTLPVYLYNVHFLKGDFLSIDPLPRKGYAIVGSVRDDWSVYIYP